MSVDPTTIVDLIEKCIKVYGYLKDVKESSSERSRIMREVSAFKGVLRDLQDQLGELAENGSLVTHLARLLDPEGSFGPAMKRTLQDLEDKLIRGVVEDKKGMKAKITKARAAILWTLDKSEVESLRVDIERYKSLISLALEQDAGLLEREMHTMVSDIKGKLSDVAKTVTDINANVDTLTATISADEHRKVAEWISEISFSALHAAKSREWLPGTGTWVLESPVFQKWASRTASSSMLWCYGDAGAGKSVAAAMIVEHLEENTDNVVLVIVCRYNQNREYFGETHAFMCCLLRQLLRLDSDASATIPQTLLDLYRKDRKPSEECIRTLLMETARIISRPIFIVLDALDECPLGFALVAAIERLGNTFNLLITSREVFAEIKHYPSLHIRAADDDILAVINDKIPMLPHVQDDEALQAIVRTEIVAKAEGMFLLASLKLWELEHDVTSKAAVREVLASIPTSLDKVYDQIFERIRTQGDRKKELAHQAIMWMYTLSDLHTVMLNESDLRHLLACNISTPEPEFRKDHMPSLHDIINACGGLLKVEDLGLTIEFPSFIHYSAYEYISRFPDSIKLPKDHYEVAFNICTIALRHAWVLESIWLKLARFMDSYRPAVVESVLGDPDFKSLDSFRFGNLGFLERPRWLKGLLIESSNGKPNSLAYAAAFGLPGTFRRAREIRAPDEHEFRQVMEILVICRHWDLVHELWEDGEFDPNAYLENIGTTAACHCLVDPTDSRQDWVTSWNFLRKFLQHPSASLCCPRHGDLLICAIGSWHDEYNWQPNLKSIAIILEYLAHDMKDEPSQRGRISVYLPPSRTRSRPPDILDVIAVFLQRADIDLDAHITLMVPPEVLLALLMLPWHVATRFRSWKEERLKENLRLIAREVEEAEELLRPYARPRRLADIPDADADAPADNVVPDMAQAAEAQDTCAMAEPGLADNAPAQVPPGEVLDNRVVMREVEVVDTYRMTLDTYRMTLVHLIIGATISLFIYLSYLQY